MGFASVFFRNIYTKCTKVLGFSKSIPFENGYFTRDVSARIEVSMNYFWIENSVVLWSDSVGTVPSGRDMCLYDHLVYNTVPLQEANGQLYWELLCEDNNRAL